MIYAFGPFELDTRIYELREAGSVRPVEPQVFDILAYLVANRERVISKEELLEKLWPDRFVSEATLTSRLKEARKAVGDTGRAQSIIRTHHGRGYRFIAGVEERGDPSSHALTPSSGEYVVEPSAPATGAAAHGRGPQQPFVGRARELEVLDRALRVAAEGTRQILFVAGEAGTGKTTLVEAFLGRHGGLPMIARGQCVEHRGSGEPYMPLLDAFARLCRGSGGAAIVELLQREAPSWLVQMPSLVSDRDLPSLRQRAGEAGERMLRELAVAVEHIAADKPLVLVIEDLHWSDYATLEAIDLLARQSHPARLLLIGTFRPSDRKAARHPVYAVSHDLRTRRQCEVLDLAPLGPTELGEYLNVRFDGPAFASDLAQLVHARTGGNPLFAGILIDSWIAQALVARDGKRWVLKAPLRTLEKSVPDSLQLLIEKEVGELDPERQRLLEGASVIGREFCVAALAGVLALPEEELERECESLAREGKFLKSSGVDLYSEDGALTSMFTFVHDLYVDVLYESIPVARKVRSHLQAGAALERAWGQRPERAAELALHFQRGLDRNRAAKYLQLAATQALRKSAYREAVAHLTAALEAIEQIPQSPERDVLELQVRSQLAPALTATRGWADPAAETNYVAAMELARSMGDTELLSEILYGMATMYEYRGEYLTAERVVNTRIAMDGERASEHVLESHELLACSLFHQGRHREAVEYGQRAIAAWNPDSAKDAGKVLLRVQTHGWMSGALLFDGRPDDALREIDEGRRLAATRGDDLARASAAIQAAFIRFHLAERDQCRLLADEGLALAREHRFLFHVACGRILVGWTLDAGNHDEAEREIRGGVRMALAIGARMDIPLFQAILAVALARAGNAEGALAAVDEAIALIDHARPFFYLPELHRIRGHLLHEFQLDGGDAVESLRLAFRLAEEQQSPYFALRAAISLAAIERTPGSRELLESVYARFDQGRETRDLREAKRIYDGDTEFRLFSGAV